jgi:hypothetical protein
MFSYITKYNIKLPLLSDMKCDCMLQLQLAIIKSTEDTPNSTNFSHGATARRWAWASSLSRFHDHTRTHHSP